MAQYQVRVPSPGVLGVPAWDTTAGEVRRGARASTPYMSFHCPVRELPEDSNNNTNTNTSTNTSTDININTSINTNTSINIDTEQSYVKPDDLKHGAFHRNDSNMLCPLLYPTTFLSSPLPLSPPSPRCCASCQLAPTGTLTCSGPPVCLACCPPPPSTARSPSTTSSPPAGPPLLARTLERRCPTRLHWVRGGGGERAWGGGVGVEGPGWVVVRQALVL